ncbi:NADP-dependent oxidoreductase [Aquicoccus porphyridii]|uniref:NADP-dependent oxidoreductase n=1 Tax=Aquicoccus porphyridii TaxID=1852029 RepID=A0A5A9Z785_9RHOB|nr:NADP-dependent oxidoreductase [Aquicoccus porphyridii]KAA0913018.1 NADP-dependent oxidoreductase [Aquicoccus porphyridii]RAI54247.1 NADP-dependent oxidoreductase [Rhodobacteraceae bacterium AsT-22]
MADEMKCITLAARPEGAPKDSDFKLETRPVPEPSEGEVLVRVHYMSLDPYMRGRMDDAKSYAEPVPLGGIMEGGGAGEVIASNDPGFKPGDMAFGMFGWATHGVQPAKMLRKLPEGLPITTSLGVLGMPGFTGWYGLTEIGKPKKGETLVVAAATGPVGSMVGQIAKARGLRTVAIAGGADKCRLATEKFGFDAALDHRAYDDARSLRKALAEAAPDGIDIYFENVGGKVFEAVLPLMNRFGRIPVCGMIAGYNTGALGGTAGAGPDRFPVFWRTLLVKHLLAQGFIISNHFDRYGEFLNEVAPLVASGDIAYLEDIAEGIENAPAAFMGLLEGRNMGKQIVKLA